MFEWVTWIWLFFVVFGCFLLFLGVWRCEGLCFFRFRLAFLSVLMLIFLVAGGCCFRVFAVDDSEADAREAIAEAEKDVVDCYGAVVDAERAGANVTGLLSVLSEAGMLLSKALLAYEVRDFGSAVNFASQSREKLDGFVVEAEVLRETALQQGYWNFIVNVVGSAVGAVGVLCGGFAVWFFLERREKSRGNAK